MNRSRKGFTLAELLVVMGIIAVLAALLLPSAARSLEQTRATACMSQLRQIGVALRLYLDENGNRMPVMENRGRDSAIVSNAVELVMARQLGSAQVLRCPSDRARWFEDSGSSYFWNFLLNGQPADHLQLMGVPFKYDRVSLFSDHDDFHRLRGPGKGRNHLYGDGGVKSFVVLEAEGP